jgi:WD repeat-containing protein 35
MINFVTKGDAVVQIETFGVSLNAEGTCFYGLQVEAVMDRIKDNISLDHLSRLLVDVQSDSSAIVDAIISQYQRQLLQLVFLGDAVNRNKVNLIIANEITPHLTAEEYMDKGNQYASSISPLSSLLFYLPSSRIIDFTFPCNSCIIYFI